MTFIEFLQWLVGPGVEVVAGYLLSLLAENVEWYQNLESKAKRLVFAAVCFGAPLAGAAIGAALGYFPMEFETTFWNAIQAGAVVFFAGQLSHTRYIGN